MLCCTLKWTHIYVGFSWRAKFKRSMLNCKRWKLENFIKIYVLWVWEFPMGTKNIWMPKDCMAEVIIKWCLPQWLEVEHSHSTVNQSISLSYNHLQYFKTIRTVWSCQELWLWLRQALFTHAHTYDEPDVLKNLICCRFFLRFSTF